MQMLLSFAPFIVFALLTRVTGVDVSLWAGAAVALALVVRDRAGGGSTKMLEAGNAGLLAIILASLAIRKPFTLQYARRQASAEAQKLPLFWHVNYAITMAWAIAMAIVVVVDIALEYVPAVPLWFGTLVLLAAFYAAFLFTKWYPAYRIRMARSM